jgi:hypothetical protein
MTPKKKTFGHCSLVDKKKNQLKKKIVGCNVNGIEPSIKLYSS